MKTFAEAVLKARRKKKMTQLELAQAMGYTTPQFVSNWERNVSTVGLNDIVKLSEVLNINISKLTHLVAVHKNNAITEKIRKAVNHVQMV